MTKRILILFILFFSAGMYASYILDKSISEILKQLDLSDESAKDYIWSDISYSNFSYPSPGELKSAATGERSAIIKTVAKYAKDYTKTDAFKQKYLEFREMKKPEPPQQPQSMSDSRNAQKEQMKKSIAEMQENMKNLNADQKKMMEGVLKTFEEQLAALDKPETASHDTEYNNYMQQNYEAQTKEYENKLAEWEKEYPKDNPSPLIKKWLSDFLEESANIDFNAELRNNNYGKKVFVKSEYEEKSSLWKLCFRTGKESVEAARSFAKSWLSELK
jgi:hypothetical protein